MCRHAIVLVCGAVLFGGWRSGWAQVAGHAPPTHQSNHRASFVQADGAQLEVLDWGGKGPVLLLLPGYGMGAHIFDDLAPDLTDRFRTIAITPRGFPPSSAPDTGYTIAQLAADVRSVLDSMKAAKAVLVGHSISGAVITEFAIAYPGRLLAAVYLDGAHDFGKAYRRSKRPRADLGFPADTMSGAFQAWRRKYPDWDTVREVDSQMWSIDSAEVVRRNQLTGALVAEVRSHPHPVWRVQAPALSICAVGSVERAFGWLTPDSTRWPPAQAYAREAIEAKHAICREFARRVPRGRVVDLAGGHLIFLDCRAAVLQAIRDFAAAARATN